MVALKLPVDPEPPGDDDFVAEVRAFFARSLTADLRQAGRETVGFHAPMWACRLWQQRLYERGWAAPTWPKAFGGCAWTPRQRHIWDRECAENDAPVLFTAGLRSLGPLLIEAGTPEQRDRYLPAILRGDDVWAQGFSEPGAGSDLAAVATRAVREGDSYVVSGTKLWTSGAHLSNRMFALVRTSDQGKPRDGLSFLLLDMDSPGLSVRPVLDLNGHHEFNQVYFDEVRVPVSGRVGDENDGWRMASRLMQLARSNNTPSGVVRRTLRRAADAIAIAGDPALTRRLAQLRIELEAYAQIEMTLLSEGRVSASDPKASSLIKLLGTELNQKASELALDACGPAAAPALADDGPMEPGPHAAARYFDLRAASIYSGSSEVHRNLIARNLLA